MTGRKETRAEPVGEASSEDLRGLLDAAREENQRLTGAIVRIHNNAMSWHGPPPEDSGHVRALAVIAEWCDAALALPDTNKEGTR